MAFPVEAIPDVDHLLRRIHAQHLGPDGVISSAAFNHERLSVNWERYSTPESTAERSSAAVTALLAGDCRGIGQSVEHTPIQADEPFGPNQAHAEIIGRKDRTIRHRLRDLAKLVWARE
jgi:hypothetical protein